MAVNQQNTKKVFLLSALVSMVIECEFSALYLSQKNQFENSDRYADSSLDKGIWGYELQFSGSIILIGGFICLITGLYIPRDSWRKCFVRLYFIILIIGLVAGLIGMIMTFDYNNFQEISLNEEEDYFIFPLTLGLWIINAILCTQAFFQGRLIYQGF